MPTDLWWPYAAGRRILIIDDDPAYLDRLETMLHRAGYEVSSASQAGDTVQKAQDEKPDVIVMDRMVPTLPGFRGLAQLELELDRTPVPVVMPRLRQPGHWWWRIYNNDVIHLSDDPDELLDVLRRLDLVARNRSEAAEDRHPRPEQAHPSTVPGKKARKRMLVFSEEPRLVGYTEAMLRKAGFAVTACHEHQGVVALARTEMPDGAIIDTLTAPLQRWWSIITALKADLSTASVPLILIWTASGPGYVNSASVPSYLRGDTAFMPILRPGNGRIAAFLDKPFVESELLAAVAEALENGSGGVHSQHREL